MSGTALSSRVAELRRHLRTFDILLLTAALWFLAKFLRYVLPPLFSTFQQTYGVSNTELGMLFTGLMLGYATMQFPSGALADRIGAVRVIVGGSVVAAVASILLFVSSTYLALALAVVLLGVGTGAHKTVAITLLSAVYPDRTGRALGTMDTIGEFGGVVAPAVAVAVLAAAIAWQYLFLAAGVAGLGVALLFGLRAKGRVPDGTDEAEEPSDAGDYAAAFAAPRFTAFTVSTILYAFALNGIISFLPLYLTDSVGLSTGLAGTLYSAFYAVSIVQPVTGELGDRFGRLLVVTLTFALGAAGLVVLVLVGGSVFVLGGAVVALGVGVHGLRPVRDAYLVDLIPDDVAGGTLGIVRTGMTAVGAVASTVVGYIADVASFQRAFVLLVGIFVVGLAIVVGLAVIGDGSERQEPSPDA